MIEIAKSNTIVFIERAQNQLMDFHFSILSAADAEIKIKEAFHSNKTKVFVDCDDDAFILENESVKGKDILNVLWQLDPNGMVPNQFDISLAPALFPILALDKKGQPLMLAWGKPETIHQAMETGKGIYFSRSRNKKWIKGEESGHVQNLTAIYVSMNPFYLIYKADQIGAACHTGYYSCFFRQIFEGKEASLIYDNKVEEKK